MKRKFQKRYQAALLAYLKRRPGAGGSPAHGMGARALKAGLQTLHIARLHEQILATHVLPGLPAGKRASVIRQSGVFFTGAITPIEKTDRTVHQAAHVKQIVGILSRRTVELAVRNRDLKKEIAQRKAAEVALKKSEHHHSRLLEQSNRLQEQLRQLSRQILSAQEEERKLISRELHDVIAQTLTGINVRLATLKKSAEHNSKGLERNIAGTQRLVEKSVRIVHQFARELRPAVLDDLGLIPALHTFMKTFAARTGIHTRLTACAGVEQLDASPRTVLFRVAQEALTNVARHAHAGRVAVSIEELPDCLCMKISDDGRSFQVRRVLQTRGGKRLGLLGMRERLEMVGGSFKVDSAPNKGTTIEARIPFSRIPGPRISATRTAHGKTENL